MGSTLRRSRTRRSESLGSGLRLGAPFGIAITLHWSLIVVFTLIAVTLGGGLFPAWHPDWTPLWIWGVALAAATLFLASIAVHELAHALVGRTQGMSVEGITLFMFGGLAHSSSPPPSPKAEFLVAAVGPATSLVVGVAAVLLGVWLVTTPIASDPQLALAGADPVATILLWLGPINLLLALFNLIPGFPLDGGRILRSLLWWSTGDRVKATRWASGVGQVAGWALMAAGLVMALGVWIPLLGTGLIGGLWLLLIGWFLATIARESYRQLLVQDALDRVPASAVMRSPALTIRPDTSVEDVVENYLMASDQGAYPVVRDGRLLGLVRIDDVQSVAREKWPYMFAGEVMVPAHELPIVAPDAPAVDVLRRLGAEEIESILVVGAEGILRGVVRREDISRWLTLKSELGLRPNLRAFGV